MKPTTGWLDWDASKATNLNVNLRRVYGACWRDKAIVSSRDGLNREEKGRDDANYRFFEWQRYDANRRLFWMNERDDANCRVFEWETLGGKLKCKPEIGLWSIFEGQSLLSLPRGCLNWSVRNREMTPTVGSFGREKCLTTSLNVNPRQVYGSHGWELTRPTAGGGHFWGKARARGLLIYGGRSWDLVGV